MPSTSSPPQWHVATTLLAAFLGLEARAVLKVRRRNHVVPKHDPLPTTPLRSWRPGSRAPCCRRGGAAEGSDPAQTVRSFRSRWHKWRRKQLDAARSPSTISTTGRLAAPLFRENLGLCSRPRAAGSLSWGGGAMGECLTALLSQKI